MSNAPKQIIVIRKDLNMRKGKMVAQGAHASMKVITDIMEHVSFPMDSYEQTGFVENGYFIHDQWVKFPVLREWIDGSFKKVCVSVDSEEELLDIYAKAKIQGLWCALIEDSGLTEFGGVKTYTAVAIGPDYPENIDPITKDLKLL